MNELFEQDLARLILEANNDLKNKIIAAAFNLYVGEVGFKNSHHPDILKLGEALYPVREARRIAIERGLINE